MTPGFENDAASVSIHLNELKNKFDQCMRNGEAFAEARKLYMEIKELECFLKALVWDPPTSHKTPSQYFVA